MRRGVGIILFCTIVAAPPLHADEKTTPAKRTFAATRVSAPPSIDGDLADPAWQNAQEITGFTQHDPDDGKPATQNTVVKVVYDDEAIYFGARMDDTKPVTTLLGRRDNSLESDWFRISIDSQNDDLNGASFWVNPSNVQLDLNLYNDIYEDTTWDAVWESAAKIVSGGWVAEVRIPFSQLRFPAKDKHTWGINFIRRIASNKELDRLVNTPKSESGFVSRFADLTGLDGIRARRTFELVPYGVTRSDLTSRVDSGDPFGRPSAYRADAGLDFKYGLSSNMTLTGTVNPDFGQVEVDPAVVNLSQFETFFPEKRPFFTEGAQIFRFGNGPANSRWNFNFFAPSFFYSRRIGRSPQGSVDYDYADSPVETTILGAAKVTGKFGKGWSVGVLDALTDQEQGRFSGCLDPDGDGNCDSTRWSQSVEPMTNYLVARTTKEYGNSSRIGFLLTSVNRRLPNELTALRDSAYSAGVDGHTFFFRKAWLLEWLAGSTLVTGSKEAIASTQNSGARYYDRPDAGHVTYDPDRTSLSGFGGRAMFAKQTGKWRPNLQLQTYSPGFEVNDVGFMQRVDVINTHAVIHYINEDAKKHFRETSFWVGKYQAWNYDGDLTANGVHSNWFIEAKNYWYTFGWAGLSSPRFDDRRTRGGPVVQMPSEYVYGGGVGSDTRKKVSFETSFERAVDDWGGSFHGGWLTLTYRPATALTFSLTPSFTRVIEKAQYVTQIADDHATATFGKRYIFAELDQRTLDIGTRAEWTVSSQLSFQLYLQPFIASGGYKNFKELAKPRSEEYTPLQTVYESAENAYRASAVTFGNPDFNARSVRGSAVVRWEFRPGSAVYFVWNENREDVAPVGDFRFRRDFSALPSAFSRDVFLIKVSYWLPL
jgi:hypothetical protein